MTATIYSIDGKPVPPDTDPTDQLVFQLRALADEIAGRRNVKTAIVVLDVPESVVALCMGHRPQTHEAMGLLHFAAATLYEKRMD